MQSRVFKPDVYSIKKGLLARLLTNHGSDLISPVYRTAFPSPSKTRTQSVLLLNRDFQDSKGLTEHDSTRTMVSVEEGDLDLILRRQLNASGRLQRDSLQPRLQRPVIALPLLQQARLETNPISLPLETDQELLRRSGTVDAVQETVSKFAE